MTDSQIASFYRQYFSHCCSWSKENTVPQARLLPLLNDVIKEVLETDGNSRTDLRKFVVANKGRLFRSIQVISTTVIGVISGTLTFYLFSSKWWAISGMSLCAITLWLLFFQKVVYTETCESLVDAIDKDLRELTYDDRKIMKDQIDNLIMDSDTKILKLFHQNSLFNIEDWIREHNVSSKKVLQLLIEITKVIIREDNFQKTEEITLSYKYSLYWKSIFLLPITIFAGIAVFCFIKKMKWYWYFIGGVITLLTGKGMDSLAHDLCIKLDREICRDFKKIGKTELHNLMMNFQAMT